MKLIIQKLKETTSMTVSPSQNGLKCDIRIFTLWNWEKNGCHSM